MLNPKKNVAVNGPSVTQRVPFTNAELLERTFAVGKQSYFVLDGETNQLTWPDATFALWGRDPVPGGYVTLEWVFSTIHDDDRDAVVTAYLDPKWNELNVEYRIQLPDGIYRHIRNIALRDRDASGRVVRVFGLLQDISDERRVAGELTANRTFLDLALRSTSLAIWEVNLDTDEVTGNEQINTLLGYAPGELDLVNQTWDDLCHPDDRAGRQAALASHMTGETDQYEHEYRLRAKSGEWVWVLANGQIVGRHPDGRPHRMAGTTIDITARKSAEQDIGAENELLSLALHMGKLGYFYRDATSKTIFWALETYRIWGVESIASGPTPDWMLSTVHAEDRDGVSARIYDPSWNDMEHDFRIVRPDGQTRYIRGQMIRQKDASGNILSSYGIYQDISEFSEMQSALIESEARFRSVFETSGAGIVITDDSAEVRYINKAFADILGYAAQDLIGRNLTSFSPEGEQDPIIPYAPDLRDGIKTSLSLEKRYRHAKGHSVWMRVNINVADGLGLGEQMFIGVAQDVTERKEAEQREAESRLLLEEAQRLGNIGHWTWVPDDDAVEWSSQMYRILGLNPDQPELKMTPFRDYVHADDRAVWDKAAEKILKTGKSHSLEYRLVQVDGTVRHVVGRAERDFLLTGAIRLIGTVQDLTGQKRSEEVLQRAIDTAEAGNRAKSKFLASMSHELRTPLNAILGFTQLLSLKTRGLLNDDQRAYVNNIVQGGEHLLGLINDVLDLARIDPGQLAVNVKTIDAVETTGRVLKNFQQLAESRAIEMTFAPESLSHINVRADQMRLTQVIVNLTSNAIKYNRAGGFVTFKISETDDGFCRISVFDTGYGIPTDRTNEVFQSFNRLGAEAGGEEGTGIGLALSKNLVERMNGRIDFAARPEGGTHFWVDLPLP